MSALTLRLPDEKYQRLKDMAHHRGQSVNRLLDEVTSLMLAERNPLCSEVHKRLR